MEDVQRPPCYCRLGVSSDMGRVSTGKMSMLRLLSTCFHDSVEGRSSWDIAMRIRVLARCAKTLILILSHRMRSIERNIDIFDPSLTGKIKMVGVYFQGN